MGAFINIVNVIKEQYFCEVESRDIIILDVGCGNGDEVELLTKRGFSAYGCDFSFKKGKHVFQLENEKKIRIIEYPYKFPFTDEFADILITNQVIEHVREIDIFFSEVKRVMKPTALGIHCYPNINRVLEPHVKIPFATRLQNRGWVSFWFNSSFRNIPEAEWRKQGIQKIVAYLRDKTCFRSNKNLRKIASKYFEIVWFDGDLLLQAISNKRKGKLFRSLPFGGSVFNSLWTSLLLTRNPKKTLQKTLY